MIGKKITPDANCVLMFPERLKNKRRSAIVQVPDKTRLGWAEEWIQFKLDAFDLEVRKEDKDAATLEHDLRCMVVAKATVQINDSKFEDSLPKVVAQFRCPATSDKSVVLNSKYFESQLRVRFKMVVEKIIRGASYDKLMHDVTYKHVLQGHFDSELKLELDRCGFCFSLSNITFTTIKPGEGNLNPAMLIMLKKWQDMDLAKRRSDADFTKEGDVIADAAKTAEILRTEAMEVQRVAAKERELIRNSEFEKERRKHAIENAEEEKKKEIALAKICKEQEEFTRTIQEASSAYAHAQNLKNRADQLALKLTDIANESEIRSKEVKRQTDAMDQELALLSNNVEKVKHEKEIAQSKAEIEASFIEAKIRAEQTMLLESTKSNHKLVELLLSKLPEVLKHMPKEDGGDITTVNLGPAGSEGTALKWQTVGLALIPTLKKLLGGLTGDTKQEP